MLRRFPQTVRRTVIDGVAPADMALPASFSTFPRWRDRLPIATSWPRLKPAT
jgi:hypothetical protein